MKKHYEGISLILFILVVSLILRFVRFEVPTSISVSKGVEDIPKIILDAGHGGYDPGAVRKEILEKDINLDITEKLYYVLCCLGFNTILTRSNDTSLNDDNANNKKQSDLDRRLGIANEENSILVSLHQNMYSEGKYKGSQVFYNNVFGSKDLAEILQKNIVDTLQKQNNRTIKNGDYLYLLKNCKNVAVMIECGFMSNDEELALLTDEPYQLKLSYVVAMSLFEYIFSHT